MTHFECCSFMNTPKLLLHLIIPNLLLHLIILENPLKLHIMSVLQYQSTQLVLLCTNTILTVLNNKFTPPLITVIQTSLHSL